MLATKARLVSGLFLSLTFPAIASPLPSCEQGQQGGAALNIAKSGCLASSSMVRASRLTFAQPHTGSKQPHNSFSDGKRLHVASTMQSTGPEDGQAKGQLHNAGNPVYRVQNIRLNARSGPGGEYDIITRLEANDHLVELDRQGEWSHVALADGQKVWVHNGYISKPFDFSLLS
ncbi:MAG: SH3 domain-containing protein, partial [Cohaesibacter sp.]|nr:SH3 domain-containing protein [Cohaesibacter sp.]